MAIIDKIVEGGVAGIVGPLFKFGEKLIDALDLDDAKKNEAKLKLMKLQQDGDFREIETSMQAIVMAAQSQDRWISRARPAFLYVVYILILAALPTGILYAFKPDSAEAIAGGVCVWLSAIPEPMWWLFGSGYLGYSVSRSYDKTKIIEGLGSLGRRP